ncbi:hypothetical protein IT895_03670 [Halomonas sp. A40-4]|uniref:hypothetical protein n=1 Tax=Halomonas sp. A40-4 TaxID=2785909 RepID=UPI0018F0363F|nr:hypothetical protein [Halomonas sp. A40-4]QPL46916.1 hypothetical protein IT895_03670 [Halomonas sp. A40-4]
MTSNHISDRHALALTSRRLTSFLSHTVGSLAQQIRATEQEIRRIKGLAFRSEEQERETALSPMRTQTVTLRKRFLSIRQKSGLGWILSPVNTFRAWRDWRHTKDQYAQAERQFDEPEVQAQRTRDIAVHNRDVEEQRSKLLTLNENLSSYQARHAVLAKFQKVATAPMAAACGEGWLAADFAKNFESIAGLVQTDRVAEATKLLEKLVFQIRPSAAVYAGWQQEAQDMRDRAYSDHAGIPATGAFTEIAEASAKLAAASMLGEPARKLALCSHPADQWQLLPLLATSPQHFTVDVLWTIYWPMFQCAQQMADFLSDTEAHEDPLNGRFSTNVESWLSGWAAKRIPKFGYPKSSSYLGTLQLASKAEESRVGADLGIIISLNVGGLRCRKAVLLQAKRAKQGIANIGSSKGQLSKLSRLPRAGYYLFYHESPFTLYPPVPTVSSAEALQQCALNAQKDPGSPYLRLDVRKDGWDWASFVSFGLCNAESDLGEPFDTIEDAFGILGSGTTGGLPRHLFLVAIEDEPYVLELRKRLREYYRDTPEKGYQKIIHKHRHHPRSHDGPEFSL